MMSGWWKLLPVEWQVGLLTGGVLALLASYGVTYAYGDHQGAVRTDLKWQVKWDDREVEIEQQPLHVDKQLFRLFEEGAEKLAEIEIHVVVSVV